MSLNSRARPACFSYELSLRNIQNMRRVSDSVLGQVSECDITTFVWKRCSTPTNRQVPSQHNCHSRAAAAGVDTPWASLHLCYLWQSYLSVDGLNNHIAYLTRWSSLQGLKGISILPCRKVRWVETFHVFFLKITANNNIRLMKTDKPQFKNREILKS